MKLSEDELFLLSQCAISAACQAGHIIEKHADKSLDVQSKSAGDSLASQVVTEVDYLAEKIILQTLLPSCKMFDLGLLSEETPDDGQRLQKNFFWCIDPMDGTLSFINATPGYAVSIALVHADGTPYIGVVYDPVSRTLYHAIKNGGAFRNGEPLKPKMPANSEKNRMTFISDRSFEKHPLFSQAVTELEKISLEMGYQGLDTVLQGGAVMNACQVLEKPASCYFKFPKPQQGGGCLWDYAATACLFSEVGAIVTDIYGNPLDLNRPDSSFMNHRGILYTPDTTVAERVKDLYATLERPQRF